MPTYKSCRQAFAQQTSSNIMVVDTSPAGATSFAPSLYFVVHHPVLKNGTRKNADNS